MDFAISIGVVVDDAIIGLENVWRRLRENRTCDTQKSLFSAVLEATLEVRSPIVYATFIVVAVFWPVLMMSGVNGRLFAPLGVAFILAALASLVVAITLTPALCYLLLARAETTEPAYILWLKRRHRRCLEGVARRPKTVIGATVAICVAAAAGLPYFGGEFLPEFKEGHYIIRMLTAPGTSTQASVRLGTAITHELLQNRRVRSVAQQVGRAEQGEDTIGPEFSEFHVELKALAGGEEETAKDEIRAVLETFPGGTFAITPFIQERIEEIIAGGHGEVVINLFGNDLRVLDQKAEEVRQLAATVSGATDVLLEAQSGSPEATISLRQHRLMVAQEGMDWGLDTAVHGATERLLPVLMTALVVALGLLPIAIRSSQAGHEIEGPMAIVILGGLATSTVLNLLVLPTLALRYGQFEKPAA